MPFATVLNYRGMITDAVAVLLQRGASKLALVGEAIDAQAFDTLVRQTARTSDRNSVSTEQIKHDRAIEGGIRVADQIAARSSKQRPDALIFLDDFVAAGATHKWASIGNYAPKIAVITSKQIPQTWSLPVLRFETDIEEFADRGAKMMREVLFNPNIPPRKEWVKPHLREE